MKRMRHIAIALLGICIVSGGVAAAQDRSLIELSRTHYEHREYYNSITELMRYQYCNPGGAWYAESMLLMGKAYFMGGNYTLAINTLTACGDGYRDTPEGEESLFLVGYMRLMRGSPLFAYKSLNEYKKTYPGGRFLARTDLALCYANALLAEPKEALATVRGFRETWRDTGQGLLVQPLEAALLEEINRPQKKVWASVLGSIFIPGFGHFYTGKYKEGVFTLLTNALFAFLIYNGYRNDDMFQMVFFSLVEVVFYQYNIFSAVRNVYDYNSREPFYRKIRLQLSASF